VELDGRQPIINNLLHLARHPKGIWETELLWLEEHRKSMRGYERMAGHDEPQTLCGSMKVQ
jgi:hypothetical protein